MDTVNLQQLKQDIVLRTNYPSYDERQTEYYEKANQIKKITDPEQRMTANKELENEKYEILKKNAGDIEGFTKKLHAGFKQVQDRLTQIKNELNSMGPRPSGMFAGKAKTAYDAKKTQLENEDTMMNQMLFSIKRIINVYPLSSTGGKRKTARRKSAGRKSAGRKSAGRKSAGRKSAGRKSTGRKSAGRKSTGRKNKKSKRCTRK